jgi:hypothetical protein
MTDVGGLDRSAKQTLDRQLATGAIDVDDYRRLELGIHRHQLRQPYSVYASDKKTFMERSPNVALRFDIEGRYRSDVVMDLLRWMADGNRL